LRCVLVFVASESFTALHDGAARLVIRVIPAIDLNGGVVVHGVRGQRALYRPLQSRLADSPQPACVARGLRERLGLTTAYVADLDAIAGAEPDWAALRAVADAGLDLLVDAGVGTAAQAQRLLAGDTAALRLAGVVVALECSAGPAALAAVVDTLGPDRALFSLDLRHGVPLTSAYIWRVMPPEAIAETAVRIGFRRLIVLDVARVGAGEGPGLEALCGALRRAHPAVELVAGGGVRGVVDLQALARSGCDAALVASALHDGRISREGLRLAQSISSSSGAET
jgi:phosphoribosylformimino-5-aminoimidazole carboxamide ribotide isomerase